MGLLRKIDIKLLTRVLIFSFVIGTICHGYRFFNSSFSHDSLYYFYYRDFYSEVLSTGRYFRPLYSLIKGDIALPWLNGLLSLLFIGIACYFTIELLEIRNRWVKILICAVMVCNPSVTLTNATYVHDVDCYALALLFVCMGMYLCCEKKYVSGCTLFVVSMGLYQAYIQVAVFLCVIIEFKDILSGNSIKEILKLFVCRLFVLGVSMVLYFIIYKLILLFPGLSASAYYNSMENIRVFDIYTLIVSIKAVLSSELGWLLGKNNNSSVLVLLVNVVSIFTLLSVTVKQCFICKFSAGWYLAILFMALVALFGGGCTIFLMGSYHGLMMYSYYFVYVLLLVVCDGFGGKEVFIAELAVIVFIYDCVLFSNKLYLRKEMEANSTLSYMTRVLDRMEMIEEYELNKTPVAFIGDLSYSDIYHQRDGFKYDCTGIGDVYSLTYYGTYEKYFDYVLNYPLCLVSEKEAREISKLSEVEKMGDFPARDSVRMIDGVLVVKLSGDWEDMLE